VFFFTKPQNKDIHLILAQILCKLAKLFYALNEEVFMQAHLLNIDTALITPRTVVRRFRENDGQNYFKLFQDNQDLLENRYPPILDVLPNQDNIELFVRKKLASWLMQEEFCLGVWDKDSAVPIGLILITNIDWNVPNGELFMFLDKNRHQKGIMTEVLQKVIQFAFEQLRMEKLTLRTESDNFAGQRLARKCGFSREGDVRSAHRRPSGELVDLMLFGLVK
jgi:RimJ/RimL family protein N-acetyltransferase